MHCGSVQHYSSLRSSFLVAPQGKLGDDGFEHFQSLDSFRKASFILGSELWEDKFGSLLGVIPKILKGNNHPSRKSNTPKVDINII